MLVRPRLPASLLRGIAAAAARGYAVQAPGNPTFEVFNRKTKYIQKERAAKNVELSRKVDYLKDEVALRLTDRLLVRTLHSLLFSSLESQFLIYKA